MVSPPTSILAPDSFSINGQGSSKPVPSLRAAGPMGRRQDPNSLLRQQEGESLTKKVVSIGTGKGNEANRPARQKIYLLSLTLVGISVTNHVVCAK
jgi:hypothetical protein